MAPRVSVLLPTLQAEHDLERLLPVLAAQRVRGGFELRAIDSDSSDRTRWMLRRAGAWVERIERREFRHGPTRNRLAEGARGEVLVFLSQDALPEGEDALERLVAALEDPSVAGATARLLPHPQDDPLTARTVLAAPEASAEPRVFGPGDEDLFFHDVASALRAAVWRRHPFPDVPFGEDLAWARAVVAAGHRVAFVPGCVVRHAHAYTPGPAFERYRVDAAYRRREWGQRVRPDLVSVARGVAYELREDWRHVRRHGGWPHLLRAPALRGAQVLGQYFGSRGWNPGGTGSGAATRRYD